MIKLEEQLASDISKANVNYIVHMLGNNEHYFKELLDIIKRDEYKISVMAAWVWENVAMKYPDLVTSYIPEIIDLLSNFTITGIERFFLKILSQHSIPENAMGGLYNLCYNFIDDPNETLAVKVHSMQIMYNISETEKDLKPELASIIEYQYELNSAGFKSRSKKLLKKLYKQTK